MLFDFLKRRDFPMLMFISHAKAGSMWVDGILRSLFGKRVYPIGYNEFQGKPERGRVGTAFMTREQFQARPEMAQTLRFILLRDLRDTFVSRYFSMRATHEDDPGGKIAATREALQARDKEDGLLFLLAEPGMVQTAQIQRSWMGSGEEILMYEDVIFNALPHFQRLFRERLKLPVSEREVAKAVYANSFEAKYGRKLGQEDKGSHGRKGAPGDWKNHFTPALASVFNDKYGDVLLATGAEKDPEWHKKVTPSPAA